MRDKKWVRYTANGVRIFMAIAFVFFGFSYFFMPADAIPMDVNTPEGRFMAALFATGYFLPFLKAVEGIAGVMMFWKRWTPLALLVLSPIVIQIFLYDLFLQPAFIWMGLLLGALLAFLGWYNWHKFAPLFKA